MSSSNAASNGQLPKGFWAYMAPYVTPPVAASVAIIPVFYGFIAKSAKQMGEPVPKMTPWKALQGGLKASPTIGTIVGTQMVVQNVVEKILVKNSSAGNSPSTNFGSILISSVIVGGVSAPALAVFNGQTMGRGAVQSLRMLTAKQTSAIVIRETSFLFSLRISDPAGKLMKQVAGNNKAVEYSSAFVSGAIGSVIGHPADTALTLWQRNVKIKSFRQLMRGSPAKALAVGVFSMGYKFIKEALEATQGLKK